MPKQVLCGEALSRKIPCGREDPFIRVNFSTFHLIACSPEHVQSLSWGLQENMTSNLSRNFLQVVLPIGFEDMRYGNFYDHTYLLLRAK